MKVIISRKGFDSGYGGIPSPILPDGTMLSMPIPSPGDKVRYKDLVFNNDSYATILQQLKPNCKVISEDCHLDPDIREEVTSRLENWKPAFGQIGAAQSHLRNQGVGIGDLFLFFGWFRPTIRVKGKLEYNSQEESFHAIYGYMQVGDVITREEDVPEWLKTHPHACHERWNKNNNAIYVAAESLSFNPNLPGAGCFRYTKEHKLSKDGCRRSVWALPDFFREIPITYNANAWQEDGFHSAAKGQEFVFNANDNVMTWLNQDIFNRL